MIHDIQLLFTSLLALGSLAALARPLLSRATISFEFHRTFQ